MLYARVSSADRKDDLQRQGQRLQAFALEQGWTDFDVVAEIGSGLNGKRKKRLRALRDPRVSRIVVEHRDRLAGFGFEMVEAALAAAGKRVVVVEEGEVADDLVRDLLEILPSACGRLECGAWAPHSKAPVGPEPCPAGAGGDGMRVMQGFRFELDPNGEQRVALAKHVGAARFAYNWGLSRCLEALEQGLPLPSAAQLHKAWNIWKRENASWWVEVSKCAPQEAFRDLERAFRNWRQGRAGRPRFKRKKSLDDNKARLTGSIRVTPRHVQLPRIGRVRTKERTDKLMELLQAKRARILSATISREADRWFVSLTCEVEHPDPSPRNGDVVGVDLGLMSFLVLSDGTRIEAPKPLSRGMRLLKRRSKQLSRKQKGSNNHRKASLRLARLHRRIRNIRRDWSAVPRHRIPPRRWRKPSRRLWWRIFP